MIYWGSWKEYKLIQIYETAKVVTKDIKFGENCVIGDFAFVAPRKLVMADGSQIGPHAILSGGGEIYLEESSVVGFGVKLICATDSTSAPFMCESAPPDKRDIVRGSITLGERAYIGSGAVICVSKEHPHIMIGDYSVVGALTYLDRSLDPFKVIYPKKDYVEKKRVLDSRLNG